MRQETSSVEMVKQPLLQTMFLLWLIGIWKIFEQLFTGQSLLELHSSYSITVFLGALVTGLLAGQTRQLALLPLSIILLNGALLIISPINSVWLPVISASVALIIWLTTLSLLKLPLPLVFLGWQSGYGTKGGRLLTEQIVHWTIFTISLLTIIGSALVGDTMALFLTLSIVSIFFSLAGLRYRLQLHSYLLIVSICLATLTLISTHSTLYLLKTPQITTPILTLMAIVLAILAHYPIWQKLYKRPLHHTASLIYIWALLNSLFLFFTDWQIWLPFIFILLALAQLPLSRSPTIRGIAIGLLLSLAFTSSILEPALQKNSVAYFIPQALILWGFILWGAANYGLPRLKAPWEITQDFWPTLGLLFVISGFWLDIEILQLLQWQTLLIVTLYLLLMFRNANWWWLSSFTALSLTISGLTALYTFIFPPLSEQTIFFMICGMILWANFLLLLSWLSQHYDQKWQIKRLYNPLFLIQFLILTSGLLLLTGTSLFYSATVWEKFSFWREIQQSFSSYYVTIAILLNLSFLHALSLRPHPLIAHNFLLSLLNIALLLFFTQINLPLLLSLWTVGLLSFLYIDTRAKTIVLKTNRQVLINAMRDWIPISFGAALLSLILMLDDISTEENLFTLALLSGLSLIFGLLSQRQNLARGWLAGGTILLGVLLHVIWLIWQPQAPLTSLLAWYALQNALLAWAVFWLKTKLPLEKTETKAKVHWLLTSTAPLLATLATIAWLVHIVNFFIALNTQQPIIYLFGDFNHLAALLAGILLIKLWWQNSENLDNELLIYGIVFFVVLLGIYIRLLWIGLAPLNVWDTATLMCAGYILFTLHHFIPSLHRLTLLMPILAILTVPLQLDSIYASSTLLAGATLYLLIQPRSQNNLPMYLGLLALNISIYLWIPNWADNYKLLQLYTIPIAITVLLMLQLHQLELKPRVMNATRLTALSALYAAATLDVFMRPELSIFMLAIGLSLGGVVLGIALRVRAFLYLGTLFLVFNVFGQLIDLYPENILGKAIMLMVLGGIITGGMIWFNIQREALMQQIRIIRADLAQWE